MPSAALQPRRTGDARGPWGQEPAVAGGRGGRGALWKHPSDPCREPLSLAILQGCGGGETCSLEAEPRRVQSLTGPGRCGLRPVGERRPP